MTRPENAWEAGRAVWHGVYAALLLLVGVLATVADDLSARRELAVLALLAVGGVSWALFGAPALSCAGRPAGGRLHVAIAVPVAIAGFALYRPSRSSSSWSTRSSGRCWSTARR